MKIVMPGGSGHVGTILAKAFHGDGHEVVVCSRNPQPLPWRVVPWDGAHPGEWSREIDGCDVVINLAGRSVNCRYTAANRREILDSRLCSTRAVAEAIGHAARPPALWLQSGTATIYAHRFDAPNDERSGVIGGREPSAPSTWQFSLDVATAWECAFDAAVTPGTRKIAMRSAMTMGPARGGVFDAFATLVSRRLGGASGDGRQFVSWIHYADFTNAIRFLIDRDDIDGVVNLSSPNPLPNAEFMHCIREAAGVRFGLPAPRWMLEIGAVLLQTETELILKSRRVVPTRLMEAGFRFRHPEWREASVDLYRKWRGAM